MDNITGILQGMVHIVNARASPEIKRQGMYCTLCMMIEGKFVDIHMTKEQLIDLKEKIESHLEFAKED